jgi:hypothetical protein
MITSHTSSQKGLFLHCVPGTHTLLARLPEIPVITLHDEAVPHIRNGKLEEIERPSTKRDGESEKAGFN